MQIVFLAHGKYNGRSVPFIGIIRTTLIASTTFALTHFGPRMVCASGHNDCNLFRNKDFVLALTMPPSEHMEYGLFFTSQFSIWRKLRFWLSKYAKIKIYFHLLQLLAFSCYWL